MDGWANCSTLPPPLHLSDPADYLRRPTTVRCSLYNRRAYLLSLWLTQRRNSPARPVPLEELFPQETAAHLRAGPWDAALQLVPPTDAGTGTKSLLFKRNGSLLLSPSLRDTVSILNPPTPSCHPYQTDPACEASRQPPPLLLPMASPLH